MSSAVAEAALRELTERHRFLTELDAATQPLTEPAAVMATAARLLAVHLEVDRCAYAEIIDEAIFDITGDYARGVPTIVGRWPVAAFGAACVAQMRAGEPYIVDDSELDPRITPADLAAYEATTIRAVVCVPLHKAGRFTAAMAVHQAHPRHWTAAEIELVGVVVARCWEALERARVTRTLRESEARYRAIVEASPDCVKLVASDGTLRQINAAGARMIGAPSEAAVLGACVYDLIAPDFRERYRAFNEQVCRGAGGALQVEIIGLTGIQRTLELTAVPLPAPGGGFLQLAMARDITERVHGDRRKDEFIAMLAHELRNPLAPIRTGLELLKLDASPARLERTIGMMERQLGHLVRMVDDLLDISRITRGKVLLERQRIELREVLDSALDTTRPLIDANQQRLTIELPPESLLLDVDPTRLAQVLANLINNAAKYTPAGGQITVAAEREDAAVRIQVSDSGVGIPADMLPRVFEMFTQLGRTIERSQGGLGLGLSLVRQLVELHGGTVNAASPGPNLGSTFTVHLPLAPALSEAAPAPRPSLDAAQTSDRDRPSSRPS